MCVCVWGGGGLIGAVGGVREVGTVGTTSSISYIFLENNEFQRYFKEHSN